MISLIGVHKAFGGRTILQDVNLSLVPGQRLGLIGRNGTGKTTLLRLLTGELEPDQGQVARGPDLRVGYLGQEGQLDPESTLYQEMHALFAEIVEQEAQLRALEREMAGLSGRELEDCMRRYDRLQTRYQHAEPHLVDARIRTVLAGMGFRPADLERPCREFSGGWQMRGALARLLLSAPGLLLLDEPTNHLDLAAVEWLEQYLAGYPGMVLLVSHDRTFLDRVVNRVIELEGGVLEDYPGNYSFFLEERERRREQQEAAYQTQQRKLAQDERFIERFRYKATLATRVKSREKMLERLQRVDAPPPEPKPMSLSFLPATDSGREALVAKAVSKSYPSISVLQEVCLKVERGERVAVVGPNGVGKSTLLRLLAGQEAPDAGTIRAGHRLTSVYFAQHQAESLNPDRTALEELEAVAPPGTTQTRLRTILGCLLFSGDEVFKKVGVLSGGERSRVALARCIVRPSNLLFLDEPTNHLDLGSREVLLEALQDYPGTILFISHDRSFMDDLATAVVEVREGRLFRYLGNYSDYQRARQRELAQTSSKGPDRSEQNLRGRDLIPKERRGGSPGQGRSRPWSLPALEAKIYGLEDEIAALAEQLGTPEVAQRPERLKELSSRYETLTAECAELTRVWDELTATESR